VRPLEKQIIVEKLETERKHSMVPKVALINRIK
jgi:hypothetical protein